MKFQAVRFGSFFGNMGDNSFLNRENLGPKRDTYNEAVADFQSEVAVKNRNRFHSYGGRLEEEEVIVATKE
jgi:hypothetical protein